MCKAGDGGAFRGEHTLDYRPFEPRRGDEGRGRSDTFALGFQNIPLDSWMARFFGERKHQNARVKLKWPA
jgi:hypothetical protein